MGLGLGTKDGRSTGIFSLWDANTNCLYVDSKLMISAKMMSPGAAPVDHLFLAMCPGSGEGDPIWHFWGDKSSSYSPLPAGTAHPDPELGQPKKGSCTFPNSLPHPTPVPSRRGSTSTANH